MKTVAELKDYLAGQAGNPKPSASPDAIARLRAARTTEEERQQALRQVRKATAISAKYRDPVSGRTWSGRGSVPRWLREAEARGYRRDAFLIG